MIQYDMVLKKEERHRPSNRPYYKEKNCSNHWNYITGFYFWWRTTG